MRMLSLNFVLLWAMVLCGCTRRPAHTGIDYLVRPADLTEPVRLVDCDRSEPPHCKGIRAAFKPGREQIVVPKVQ
jgi:hypothetical protein